MDLKPAIQQILRGEFYLEMESDEQYEMLIDACQEMGVSTTWLDCDDFSDGYRFVGVDKGELCSLWGDDAIADDNSDIPVVKFSDLIPEFADVDGSALL